MPVIVYSVLRLGLFALALLGLWATGMGGWLLVVVAAVAAGALSYVLLGHQRPAAHARRPQAEQGQREQTQAQHRVEDHGHAASLGCAAYGEDMVRALVYVIPVALAIYALIDLSRSEPSERMGIRSLGSLRD